MEINIEKLIVPTQQDIDAFTHNVTRQAMDMQMTLNSIQRRANRSSVLFFVIYLALIAMSQDVMSVVQNAIYALPYLAFALFFYLHRPSLILNGSMLAIGVSSMASGVFTSTGNEIWIWVWAFIIPSVMVYLFGKEYKILDQEVEILNGLVDIAKPATSIAAQKIIEQCVKHPLVRNYQEMVIMQGRQLINAEVLHFLELIGGIDKSASSAKFVKDLGKKSAGELAN